MPSSGERALVFLVPTSLPHFTDGETEAQKPAATKAPAETQNQDAFILWQGLCPGFLQKGLSPRDSWGSEGANLILSSSEGFLAQGGPDPEPPADCLPLSPFLSASISPTDLGATEAPVS